MNPLAPRRTGRPERTGRPQRPPPIVTKTAKLVKLASSVASFKLQRRSTGHLASELRRNMEEAGTLFIKIGQWISARTDVFPADVTRELAELRVNVSSLNPEVIKDVLVKNSLSDAFETFDEVPLSCGSIAQVHRATLAGCGTPVAVKIQRPSLARELSEDIDIVRTLLLPYRLINQKSYTDIASSLQDLHATVCRELDFREEVRHMRAFRSFMKRRGIDWVTIPKPHVTLCTDDVIVMEFLPSQPIDGPEFCQRLLELFCLQFFELGRLHTDLHPGNLGRAPDGSIVMYDFGSVMQLPESLRLCFKWLIVQYVNRDTDRMLDTMLEYGVLTFKDGASTTLSPSQRTMLRQFVDTVIDYVERTDVHDFQKAMRAIETPATSSVDFAPEVFLVFRSFTLLEGLCKELDPSFVILDALLSSRVMSYFLGDVELYRMKAEDDVMNILRWFA